MELEPRINWRNVWGVMKVYDWTFADLSRRAGISQSLLSDVRHAKKSVTMRVAWLLKIATGLTWDKLLCDPMDHAHPSARELVGLTSLEDGRPWPVRFSKELDAQEDGKRTRLKAWRIRQHQVALAEAGE